MKCYPLNHFFFFNISPQPTPYSTTDYQSTIYALYFIQCILIYYCPFSNSAGTCYSYFKDQGNLLHSPNLRSGKFKTLISILFFIVRFMNNNGRIQNQYQRVNTTSPPILKSSPSTNSISARYTYTPVGHRCPS